MEDLLPPQQLQQLGEVRRRPSRFVPGEQLSRRAMKHALLCSSEGIQFAVDRARGRTWSANCTVDARLARPFSHRGLFGDIKAKYTKSSVINSLDKTLVGETNATSCLVQG
jgi:hypothetical protein